MSGWIKLHRATQESAIASHPEYLAVWVHLLLRAQYSASQCVMGRSVVNLEAGQLVFGRIKFAAQVGISEAKVRAALDVMKSLNMITIKSMAKFSIISITNWQKYQDDNQQITAEQPSSNHQATSSEPASGHIQESKELKESKEVKNKTITPQAALGLEGLDDSTTDKQKKPDYPEWFENIWTAYPDRSGGDNKRKALQGANARIKTGSTHADLLAAVNRYRVYIIATGRMGTEYVKQAATFFGSVDNITNQWLPPAGPPIKPGPTAANLNFTAKDYDNGINPDGSF